jgi:hypothetical protein
MCSGHTHHSKVNRGEKLTQSSCGEILGKSLEDLRDDGRILRVRKIAKSDS